MKKMNLPSFGSTTGVIVSPVKPYLGNKEDRVHWLRLKAS
jgi:hypothetical protein